MVSSNFYWLSTKDDVLDWDKSTWYYTPTQSFADYTQLQSLRPVTLSAFGWTVRRRGITDRPEQSALASGLIDSIASTVRATSWSS